jgi:FkbM family methyltransferase
MKALYRAAFKILCAISRPLGLPYNRIHDVLGRRAYDQPEFSWLRNRWGAELLLSPHYHIDRNIILAGCYDEELHLLLEQLVKPSMICLDVGANMGEMALHMAKLAGPSGAVLAFEPVAAIHERLQGNIQRNHLQETIRSFQIALSDTSGQCEIAFAGADADNQGLGSIVNLQQGATVLRQQVKTETLDDFAAQQKLTRIDLIKIDIQGAEIKMLKGAAGVVEKLSPDLLLEISPDDLKAAGNNSRDLCELIENSGYQMYELKRGKIGNRIQLAAVAPNFYASNVYCTKKPR